MNLPTKKGVKCAIITVLDHPPTLGTFPPKNTLLISLEDSNLGEGGKSSSGDCLGVMSASWGRPLLLHQGRPECPSGYKLNLVYFTEFYTYQGPCLGIVQRFGPSEGRDWSRGVWISEESRGIELKIFLKPFPFLGTPFPSKIDEFSEKFQTAFDPPPSFSESYIANFLNWLRSLQKMEPIETSIWG